MLAMVRKTNLNFVVGRYIILNQSYGFWII